MSRQISDEYILVVLSFKTNSTVPGGENEAICRLQIALFFTVTIDAL